MKDNSLKASEILLEQIKHLRECNNALMDKATHINRCDEIRQNALVVKELVDYCNGFKWID